MKSSSDYVSPGSWSKDLFALDYNVLCFTTSSTLMQQFHELYDIHILSIVHECPTPLLWKINLMANPVACHTGQPATVGLVIRDSCFRGRSVLAMGRVNCRSPRKHKRQILGFVGIEKIVSIAVPECRTYSHHEEKRHSKCYISSIRCHKAAPSVTICSCSSSVDGTIVFPSETR